MGFFQKIKDKLGVGGVKVILEISTGQIEASKGVISGKFTLTSKSDQELKNALVTVYEEFTTGRGSDKKTKKYELGRAQVAVAKNIKKEENQEYEFTVPFVLLKSDADQLKEKGGALGAIGSLGKFAKNEKSSYFIKVDVDVKSAVLDPFDKKEIKIL